MADEIEQPQEKLQPTVADGKPSPGDAAFTRQLSKLLQSDAELKVIPQQKLERLVSLFTAAHTEIIAKYHSGPLPAPEDLLKYNEAVHDGANRIMVMAENQSAHRIQIESLVIGSQQTQSGRGQIFGLIIGMFGISVGAIVACLGHEAVGSVIAGTTVVSLATAFILGRQQQVGDLARKREAVSKQPNGNRK